MNHETNTNSEIGITISLRIPAHDADLYNHKATDDVLLFLSRHRYDEFPIGTIADQTGHSGPSVGRAVDVLKANELVEETRTGNKRLIRIDRRRLSVPADPFLRIPQPEFHEPVREAVEALDSRLENLLGIVLYGSVARGEADRRSDIDLWVLVGGDRAASQRSVNDLVREFEEREFEGGRYEFDIDVEAVSSIPTYTEDVREIVLSGFAVYETPQFDTVEKLLMNEGESG